MGKIIISKNFKKMKVLLAFIGICIVLPFCSTYITSPKVCKVAYGNKVCNNYGREFYGVTKKESKEFECNIKVTWNHDWCIVPDKYKNITPKWRYVPGLNN